MLGKLEWLCLVLSRTAVAVWLNMSKRKRFPDLDDYADRVVADAKEMDWVARHAHLRLYPLNATMFRNMQSRLSPDEWLHGCYTGGRVAHGCAIPLREYSSARSCNDTPKRQLTIHDFCKATAVAADSKATAVAAFSKADDTPKRQLTIHDFCKVSPQLR